MAEGRWRIRLTRAAERDFASILEWTAETFGPLQANVYRDTILDALASLNEGPDVFGSRQRDEILPGLRSLRIARRGRRGRHVLLYRTAGTDAIEVVRILHQAMDLPRHVRRSRQ